MAWTTPKTWSVGETLTAANFNIHIRDNLNATHHLLALKTADESVTSGGTGTTFQDDDHLFFAVAANEVWVFDIFLYWTDASAGTADIKTTYTWPAGGTAVVETISIDASGAIASYKWTTSGGTVGPFQGSTVGDTAELYGIIANGGTAGNFRVQWAQQSASASAVTMKIGSHIRGFKAA